ncbi:hypothetical protein E2C01_094815 [Portunus trituberculatus]|uniref:Uncharacterized protein n=1 Tax=Portunus trituberculatus TaxID=210409 RepID=A0A5B7JTH3_PORTR|nr:hypothetical protein [Portunus trituberculatus]
MTLWWKGQLVAMAAALPTHGSPSPSLLHNHGRNLVLCNSAITRGSSGLNTAGAVDRDDGKRREGKRNAEGSKERKSRRRGMEGEQNDKASSLGEGGENPKKETKVKRYRERWRAEVERRTEADEELGTRDKKRRREVESERGVKE